MLCLNSQNTTNFFSQPSKNSSRTLIFSHLSSWVVSPSLRNPEQTCLNFVIREGFSANIPSSSTSAIPYKELQCRLFGKHCFIPNNNDDVLVFVHIVPWFPMLRIPIFKLLVPSQKSLKQLYHSRCKVQGMRTVTRCFQAVRCRLVSR